MLAGQIRRAVGERLHAVIMMTDMRGFTAIFGNVAAADRLDFTMIEIGANLADFLAGTERKSGWLKDSSACRNRRQFGGFPGRNGAKVGLVKGQRFAPSL